MRILPLPCHYRIRIEHEWQQKKKVCNSIILFNEIILFKEIFRKLRLHEDTEQWNVNSRRCDDSQRMHYKLEIYAQKLMKILFSEKWMMWLLKHFYQFDRILNPSLDLRWFDSIQIHLSHPSPSCHKFKNFSLETEAYTTHNRFVFWQKHTRSSTHFTCQIATAAAAVAEFQ